MNIMNECFIIDQNRKEIDKFHYREASEFWKDLGKDYSFISRKGGKNIFCNIPGRRPAYPYSQSPKIICP